MTLERHAIDTAVDEAADRVTAELDDAFYYLRHDCQPCAERHFQLALRHGATPEQIAEVRRLALE